MSRVLLSSLLVCVLFGTPLFAAPAPVGAWFFLPCGARSRADIAKLTAVEFARQVRRPASSGTAGSQSGTFSAGTADGRAGTASSSSHPEVFWRPARFPHADFDRIQPQNNVFGWYGRLVEIPADLAGRDLVLDLGVIDDADVTYVNGVEVGRSGSFETAGKSAWNRDRCYRVPAKLLKPGPNLVLVHVKDFWGLGGVVGPPVIGAALAPADAKWDFLDLGARGKGRIDLEGLNRAKRLPRPPAGGWTSAPIPDSGWNGRMKRVHGYGAYRLRFTMSPKRARALVAESAIAGDVGGESGRLELPGPVLDLGPVFDVAAVFLNGVRIAQCGRFPEKDRPAFVETAKRLRCCVPARLLRAGEDANELTVIVYNTVQRGGLPGIPVWVWRAGGVPCTWNPDGGPGGTDDAFARRDRTATGALFSADLYAASGEAGHAAELLANALHAGEFPAPVKARLLSALVFLQLSAGASPDAGVADDGRPVLRFGLELMQRLLMDHPEESISQDAMQAFCGLLRRAGNDAKTACLLREFFPALSLSTGAAVYLGADRTTRGDWLFEYGREFYSLSAMAGRSAWTGGRRSVKLLTGVPGGRDSARCWRPSWLREIAYPGALLMPGPAAEALAALPAFRIADFAGNVLPGRNVRRAAWLDDHGEQHAFDEQGPDLVIRIPVPPGLHRLALYLYDPDWRYTRHPRQQSLLLLDGRGRLLNAVWTGKCGSGVYERFIVRGPLGLTIRIGKNRGACTAVSGVFLDEWTAPPPASVGVAGRPRRGPAGGVPLPREGRLLFQELCALRARGRDVEADRLLIAGLRKTGSAASAAALCIAFSASAADLPVRWAFLAAGRFFELEPKLNDARARPLLRLLLRRVFSHRFVPIRRRAVAAWNRRGFGPDAVLHHAARRLGITLAALPPDALNRKPAGEKR